MSRGSVSLLAVVALVALVALVAWRFQPREAFDVLPELPRLVENPAPAPAAARDNVFANAPFSPRFNAGLLACALVGVWIAVRPSKPLAAWLAFAVVAVHPAIWIATATARGAAELVATVVAVAGAVACSRDRAIVREVGAGLLVVGAWLSPSGVGVAAFAIAMAARTTGPVRPAVLLAALPRVFGAPGILDACGVRFADVDAAATALGSVAGFSSAFATLAGARATAWTSDGAGHLLALFGFVVAAALTATATRGARIGGIVAIAGAAVLGFAASGTAVVATAGFVPLVLTLAACAAEPRASGAARGANGIFTLVLFGLCVFTTWRCIVPATRSADLLVCESARLGHARPLAHRAALLALERGGAAALRDELVRRQAQVDDEKVDLDATSMRDVAVLAAQFGLAEEALPLFERSLRGPGPRARVEASAAELDLFDLKLRAGRPRVVLREIEEMNPSAVADATLAADLFVRRATALALLSLSTKFEADREARAEHARAMFSAYADALERRPNHVRALLDRGVALRATGRGIDAMKDFEKVAKLRPDLAAPHLELAKLYFSRGEGEAGEQEIAAAERAAGSADPDVVLVMSQLLVARGDLVNSTHNARALETLQHRLRGGAEELAALFTQLGAAAENARDEAFALEMATRARALGADATGENAGRVARLLRQQRDYERELAVLKDAELHDLPVQDLREQIVAAYKNHGYARLLAGDKAGACGAFLDAAERATSLEELGASPELIKKLSAEVAGKTTERVLAVAKTAYGNAQDEANAERWRGAEGAYRVSLALLPQNPYAWCQLGDVLAAQRRTQDASDAWTKAKEIGEALGMKDVVERANERLKP